MKLIRDRTVAFSGHRKLELSPQGSLFDNYTIKGDSSCFGSGHSEKPKEEGRQHEETETKVWRGTGRRSDSDERRELTGSVAETELGFEGREFSGSLAGSELGSDGKATSHITAAHSNLHSDAQSAPSQGVDSNSETHHHHSIESQLLNRLEHEVISLCDRGYTTFLTGMAQGFDLLAAEAVLAVKRDRPDIHLVAVIPFNGQARDFDAPTKRLYDHILANATESIMLSQYYTPDCFHLRNDYLVDNSSVLVCFFNGTKGGTAYTVKRGIKSGVQVINIHP